MKLTFHHINLATEIIERMNAFYTDVLRLEDVVGSLPIWRRSRAMQAIQFSLRPKLIAPKSSFTQLKKIIMQDLTPNRRVNPVWHGHIVFGTDDLAGVRQHLENWECHILIGATGLSRPGIRFSFTTLMVMSLKSIKWMKANSSHVKDSRHYPLAL